MPVLIQQLGELARITLVASRTTTAKRGGYSHGIAGKADLQRRNAASDRSDVRCRAMPSGCTERNSRSPPSPGHVPESRRHIRPAGVPRTWHRPGRGRVTAHGLPGTSERTGVPYRRPSVLNPVSEATRTRLRSNPGDTRPPFPPPPCTGSGTTSHQPPNRYSRSNSVCRQSRCAFFPLTDPELTSICIPRSPDPEAESIPERCFHPVRGTPIHCTSTPRRRPTVMRRPSMRRQATFPVAIGRCTTTSDLTGPDATSNCLSTWAISR